MSHLPNPPPSASAPEPSASVWTPDTCSHAVQFYEEQHFLHVAVADFIGTGISAGDPVVVLATGAHREAFSRRLAAGGFDVEALERAGRLTMLDARDTLTRFMNGDGPDPVAFRRIIGGVLDRVRDGRQDGTVRAYGEMVDLLWKDGRTDAAVRLEELWNELATTHRFSLLCAYGMGNFYREAHSPHFEAICREHAHVIPTESYTHATNDGVRLREVTLLQQRARALETEIAHRRELEAALRQALAERERARDERERLLERERAAREEAEGAARLKDEFLAVLSHELRTPLTAILGWTHLAARSGAGPEMVQRALGIVQRNAQAQLHVIDDLLDVSRILTGKMQMSSGPVELVALLTAAMDAVRPAAAGKAIDLELHVNSPIRIVTGDSDRLQQVMWNLLSNAIKFTPEGGRIEVRLESSGSHVQVVVRDSGEGIPPDFLPHIFERFRQADAGTTRKHGGLGLGLAVVRYLVEAHGGTVRAESAGEGQGVTVIVRLPARLAAAAASAEDVPSAPAVALDGVRVLVVDDEEDTRELFQHVLEWAGAAVEVAASVEEALDILTRRPADILIGDIGLARQDGYSLVQAVRAHPDGRVRAMRALAVTSCAGDQYRTRALAAGYDAYIAKPVEPERFTLLVSTLFGQARA